MSQLILWHSDLQIELDAARRLTTGITDPDHIASLDDFSRRLRAFVAEASSGTVKTLETGTLPWKSRPVPKPLTLDGHHGSPIEVPLNGRLVVESTLDATLRPRALRAHRDSLMVSKSSTTVHVESETGDVVGSITIPLLRGDSLLAPAALPVPGTLGAIVEALASAAFPDKTEEVRHSQDFTEWQEVSRGRAVRFGEWHAEEIFRSSQPSMTVHRPRLPADLFVRAVVRPDRPSPRRNIA